MYSKVCTDLHRFDIMFWEIVSDFLLNRFNKTHQAHIYCRAPYILNIVNKNIEINCLLYMHGW